MLEYLGLKSILTQLIYTDTGPTINLTQSLYTDTGPTSLSMKQWILANRSHSVAVYWYCANQSFHETTRPYQPGYLQILGQTFVSQGATGDLVYYTKADWSPSNT